MVRSTTINRGGKRGGKRGGPGPSVIDRIGTAGTNLQDRAPATRLLAIGLVALALSCAMARAGIADPPTPRGPYVPPPSRFWPRVELICIDTASIQRIGRYPFDRALHAKLLDKLVAAGARVIAFDLYFGSPLTVDGDRAFARAIARSKRTWLICDPLSAADDQPRLPLAILADAAQWRIGNPSIDQDQHFILGVSTRPFGRSKMPHVLIGMMADYLRLRRWPYPTPDGNSVYMGSWVMPAPEGSFKPDNTDTRRLAINADSRIRLHSYWKVMKADYPTTRFRDAVVLVGITPFPRNGEEIIFDDWNIPAWSMKSHVESLAILVEKMLRYLDKPRGPR